MANPREELNKALAGTKALFRDQIEDLNDILSDPSNWIGDFINSEAGLKPEVLDELKDNEDMREIFERKLAEVKAHIKRLDATERADAESKMRLVAEAQAAATRLVHALGEGDAFGAADAMVGRQRDGARHGRRRGARARLVRAATRDQRAPVRVGCSQRAHCGTAVCRPSRALARPA